ncbi:hypothetical protein PIB30_084220 [Stylosanthes scabra]|uniref:Uncharacterized protein n=1 Tax=Stylosanthes scabra TaxID=79078 RepID=A0ABU6URC0_9FABA|nr:hypothetical protein [Stylosanthes scabra]
MESVREDERVAREHCHLTLHVDIFSKLISCAGEINKGKNLEFSVAYFIYFLTSHSSLSITVAITIAVNQRIRQACTQQTSHELMRRLTTRNPTLSDSPVIRYSFPIYVHSAYVPNGPATYNLATFVSNGSGHVQSDNWQSSQSLTP